MRIRTVAGLGIACALTIFGATGCKSDGAKLIEHYEAIETLAEANAEDCDAMREKVSEYDAEHGQEIADIWAKGDDMSGSDEEGERLSGLIVNLGILTSKCGVKVPGIQK